MQISQTMNLKEIELIIQTGFKFCIVLQANKNQTTIKKFALNKSF